MQIIREIDDPAVMRLRLAPAEGSDRIVLSGAGLAALQAYIAEATDDPACRALVLEGTDGVFCEGMDLSWLTSDSDDFDAAGLSESMAQFAAVLEALATAPLWVIASVDGVVRAGGMGLVAAADLLMATESSSFGLPEVMLGLIPAMVLPLMCARMPEQKARSWAMLGETLDANEAHRRGFVDRVAADGQALRKARKSVLRQIVRMQPEAIARCKRFCRDIQTMALPAALQAGAATTGKMIEAETTRAHIKGFLDGEPLPWFARYRPPRQTKESETTT